jgi:AcrR family transcriptional regulator
VRGYRKQRIVDAAARLFSARPYAKVQMADVAREAGVAKPTLYRYFATKEELFLEALDGLLSELERRVDMAAAKAGSSSEALQQALKIAVEVFGQCVAALMAVGGPDSSLGARGRSVIREQARRLRGCFARIVQRGIESGEFAVIEPDFAATMMLGAVRMTAAHTEAPRQAAAAKLLGQVFGRGLALREARMLSAEGAL